MMDTVKNQQHSNLLNQWLLGVMLWTGVLVGLVEKFGGKKQIARSFRGYHGALVWLNFDSQQVGRCDDSLYTKLMSMY